MVRQAALQRPISPEAPSVDVHGTLGANPGESISRLIHEFMQEKHDECAGSRDKVAVFLRSHDELVNQAWRRVDAYGKACARYRLKNKLRRFDWSYESQDTIRDLLRKKKNQKVSPLSPAQIAARRDRSYAQKEASIWRQPIRSKVDQATVFYKPHGGVDPPSYSRRRVKAEGFESVLHDVCERYKARGVFRSVQNTKARF